MQHKREGSPHNPRHRLPKVLTRSVVARILGCSIAMVRWYEKRGRLHPTLDPNRVRRFSHVEVEALRCERLGRVPRSPSGTLAAQVFRLIASGHTFADVVIETQQDPERIRELWDQYVRAPDAPRTPALIDLADYDRRAREDDERRDARRRRLRR
jgi:hypothetical protein